ncbi:MAG: HEAT repeat domain-containing protein [Chloroflexota bacterium]
MRCHALTSDRRRCSRDAQDATNFCAEHQPMTPTEQSAETTLEPRGGIARLLTRLQPASAKNIVPDNANFAVPGWLKKSSTPQVIAHLLNDPSCLIRWAAAFVLRKRRDPAAIDPLWQVLRDDPVSFVRQQSAVALGKIGTAAALAPLIESLWHDQDAGVRQACAIALGNLGYAIATKDLAEMLGRDHAVFVRWDCALALGQVGDLTVERLLEERAEKDHSQAVRGACRESLDEIRRRK